MVRLAMAYVPSRAIAEEVTQEAWLAMVKGLSSFRGQSSLKTWLFGILLNRAKTKGTRERRSVTFSSLEAVDSSGDPAPEEWLISRVSDPQQWMVAWGWSNPDLSPEDQALSAELGFCLERAIAMLPPAQRAVIVLRDVEGWNSGEICDLLSITPENQRIRLHRARLRVRSAVEAYMNRR
jgi:RNA polymerase sigma-70 factor (ECF subfamily)